MAEPRTYTSELLDAHLASAIEPLSAELQAKVDGAGWPEGLIERVLNLRRDREEVEMWIDTGFPTVEMLDSWMDMQELLIHSTLHNREATWEDHGLLVELCAEAPEKVGEWTVTVERGPYPYAQFRLQEHPSVTILEDRRIPLGMAARSVRNTYIGGERLTAHFMSGWRIREGFRGLGLSNMLQFSPGPGVGWFGVVTYWFVRIGNSSSSWISKIEDDLADRGDFSLETDTLTATVTNFDDPAAGSRSTNVREATAADLPRCVELINRSHAGLDLFRPYTLEYLEERLDDPSWGPKPSFYASVYGWPDFRVVERDGEVVACGGLWDRGRDVRDVWRRGEETHVEDPAALLDFGLAEGHDAALAELISHFLADTSELGRSGLLVSLDFQPKLRAALDELSLSSRPEIRELHVMPFAMPDFELEVVIERPYIDLAYW